MPEYLFVYGTLMRAFRIPMQRRLARSAQFVGAAGCRGRLFDVGRYPALVVSAYGRREGVVRGELYRIRRPALLGELDAYEGCSPAHRRPWEYRRRRVSVDVDGAASVCAWAYIYHWPVSGMRRIRGGDYALWRRTRR